MCLMEEMCIKLSFLMLYVSVFTIKQETLPSRGKYTKHSFIIIIIQFGFKNCFFTHESFWDDGEHGAGRRLLQYMKTNQINNVGVIITHRSVPRHLGPDRWRIMEEDLCEVANTLDGWTCYIVLLNYKLANTMTRNKDYIYEICKYL